jgi:outer membrane lipoprotein carrier protein
LVRKVGDAGGRPGAVPTPLRFPLFACVLLLLAPVVAGAAASTVDGEALLRKVGERYAAAKTFSARFRQEIPLQNLGIVRKASGKLYFGRPLKMRWDYQTPEAQLFLADGEYFYFRPADSPEVIRTKMNEKSLGGKIPLLLLFGKGEITEMFRVEESSLRKDGKEAVLRLIPRGDGAPEVRRVDLVVDTRDDIIREVHLYDRLGGENHLYLSDIVFNPALPADLFRFHKAPGVSVVDG